MSDKTTLLSCPFCGGEYVQVRYIGGKWQEPSAFDSGYRGECCDCGVITTACDTEAEAIAAWNTRASEREAKLERLARSLYADYHDEWPDRAEEVYADRMKDLGIEVIDEWAMKRSCCHAHSAGAKRKCSAMGDARGV